MTSAAPALPRAQGYVTREEFDALVARLDQHAVEQKQMTCDLLTVLRGELQHVVGALRSTANDNSAAMSDHGTRAAADDDCTATVNDDRAPRDVYVAPARSAAHENDDDEATTDYGRNAADECDAHTGAHDDERDALDGQDGADAPDEFDDADEPACSAPKAPARGTSAPSHSSLASAEDSGALLDARATGLFTPARS